MTSAAPYKQWINQSVIEMWIKQNVSAREQLWDAVNHSTVRINPTLTMMTLIQEMKTDHLATNKGCFFGNSSSINGVNAGKPSRIDFRMFRCTDDFAWLWPDTDSAGVNLRTKGDAWETVWLFGCYFDWWFDYGVRHSIDDSALIIEQYMVDDWTMSLHSIDVLVGQQIQKGSLRLITEAQDIKIRG